MVELTMASWKCTRGGEIYKIEQGEELRVPAFCECHAKPNEFVILWNKSKWKES